MSLRHTQRTQAIAVIALIWILVCGGLAWATKSAIRVEAVEKQSGAERDEERLRALALSRLDTLAEAVLGPERNRSYEHYRAFYKPAEVRDSRDGSEVRGPMIVPSPLRTPPSPHWFLLHFQASESQGWSSPQLPEGAEYGTSASSIPLVDRPRLAKPEHWLAALRERYTPGALLFLLEQSLESEMKRRQLSGSVSSRSHEAPGSPQATAAEREMPKNSIAREIEFAQRGARLLQVQREMFPLDSCEPEKVAQENLEVSEGLNLAEVGGTACVQMTKTQMIPVWLDLTLDKHPQLALVRSASIETSHYCTLQGALLDWDRLRSALATEIRDLFPHASIVPVPPNPTPSLDSALGMMQALPARLETGPAPVREAPELSSALVTGLGVAWLTTLLALAAVTYGILKFVAMTDRRMRFVSAVSHELRTPLTSFQLYSDLLADMPREDAARRRQYATALRGEARRLSRLVENVLAYSRLGDARPRLHLEPTSPQEILDALVASMSDRCAAAGKKLSLVDGCKHGPRLNTDREFVQQILANLVENACKYSGDAPSPDIWLRATPTEDGVIFEVEDAGAGVAPGDRRTVFEPFRRSEHAGNGAAGGIGLGLTMSRYWASCLGGTLTLRKGHCNPDGYACFSLRLPSRT